MAPCTAFATASGNGWDVPCNGNPAAAARKKPRHSRDGAILRARSRSPSGYLICAWMSCSALTPEPSMDLMVLTPSAAARAAAIVVMNGMCARMDSLRM